MPYIEVDQSGKIEQLNNNTVVALSNHEKYAVLIPKKIKRVLFLDFKAKTDNIQLKLFSIALFYCLRNFTNNESKAIICLEYFGKERFIKSELVRLFDICSVAFNPKTISFGNLTKKSPAHELAISVLREKQMPNLVLSRNDIELFLR